MVGTSIEKMDRFVARLNIQHLKELLGAETDESKRRTLRDLLVLEEAKLAAALARSAKKGGEGSDGQA
jgi:hypothetical protein